MATRYSALMARLRKLEPQHTAQLRLALLRQAEPAIVALEEFDVLPGSIGVDFIVSRITSQWLIAPLEALYEACGSAEARNTYEYLTRVQKAQAPVAVTTGWAARLRSFITTEGAAAVRGITDTTRKVVRQVLVEAADAGLGIREAAAELRTKLTQLAPERAMKIVRTELIAASAQGSLLGAQATGLRLNKFWISTPGSRTRSSHAAASNQTVDLNGVFTVGGLMARYPGDPLLSAKERCNCRCSIGYKPKD